MAVASKLEERAGSAAVKSLALRCAALRETPAAAAAASAAAAAGVGSCVFGAPRRGRLPRPHECIQQSLVKCNQTTALFYNLRPLSYNFTIPHPVPRR